jgi:hypothetical protein
MHTQAQAPSLRAELHFLLDYELALLTCNSILPHIVVEWITLLLQIREVAGYILGPETGYHD